MVFICIGLQTVRASPCSLLAPLHKLEERAPSTLSIKNTLLYLYFFIIIIRASIGLKATLLRRMLVHGQGVSVALQRGFTCVFPDVFCIAEESCCVATLDANRFYVCLVTGLEAGHEPASSSSPVQLAPVTSQCSSCSL